MDLSYIEKWTWLIPTLPLVGFVVLTFWGKHLDKRLVGWVACGSVFLAHLLSWVAFFHLRTLGVDEHTGLLGWEQTVWTWFDTTHNVGGETLPFLNIPFGFLVDPLSVVMLLFVTGIGFLIHVYSTGYMAEDPGFARFFSYLNLFMASMLMLILGSSVLTLFIGWEGVGLCSYLLIGFWWREKENHNPQTAKANVDAANKAFITNRFGDFAFLIGIAVLMWAVWQFTGHHGESWTSLSFVDMRAHMETFAELEAAKTIPLFGGIGAVTLACILFFIGATGKSAQIPLYVWLPDAMAGPTPVSALIHAATMVTAGVYMVCRLNFLYQLSPVALAVVAVIGALTAVFAATIGLFQYDIKAVLAYSTVSQLGYMFIGVGTGVFAVGMFHVFTHAFFKALLFLGAGSIIHALHHVFPHGVNPQDMRHMGGLRKYLPTTYRTFWVAWIAIIGIFPFAGFWSKDEILWQAFNKGYSGHEPLYYVVWGLGFAGALLTAFYMSRLVFRIFRGDYVGGKVSRDHLITHGEHGHPPEPGEKVHVHDPHESPFSMTFPLVVLAIGAAVAGFLGIPKWFTHLGVNEGWTERFGSFLEPAFVAVGHGAAHHAEHAAHPPWTLEMGLAVASVVLAFAAAAYAGYWFLGDTSRLKAFYARWQDRFAYVLVLNKYFVDELYDLIFIQRVLDLKDAIGARFFARKGVEYNGGFDWVVIDAFIVNFSKYLMIGLYSLVGFLDTYLVDGEDEGERKGFIAALVKFMEAAANRVQHLQSGDIRRYLRVAATAAGIGAFIWLAIIGIRDL